MKSEENMHNQITESITHFRGLRRETEGHSLKANIKGTALKKKHDKHRFSIFGDSGRSL